VPAAAVIPAPIAYIKVVVVKKLVVGCRRRREVVPTRDVLRVALLSFTLSRSGLRCRRASRCAARVYAASYPARGAGAVDPALLL